MKYNLLAFKWALNKLFNPKLRDLAYEYLKKIFTQYDLKKKNIYDFIFNPYWPQRFSSRINLFELLTQHRKLLSLSLSVSLPISGYVQVSPRAITFECPIQVFH